MKPKTMILMLVAVGCGLGAAVATSKYAGRGEADPVSEEEIKFPVLIAQRDLGAYTNIKEAPMLFVEERWAKNEIPKGAMTDFKEIEGRALRIDLKKGEPLVETDLVKAGDEGITWKLNEGERAFTVKVDAIKGTAGFIRPNDRVDIVASTNRSANGEAFAKIILQDIEVLAIEAQMQAQEGQINKPVDNVTLRVTPEQVEILAVYAHTGQGNLGVVPRRKGDIKIVNTPGASPSGTAKGTSQAGPGRQRRDVVQKPSDVSPVPLLAPTLPDVPAVAEKEEEPKAKRHIMRIVNTDQKVDVFVFDDPVE